MKRNTGRELIKERYLFIYVVALAFMLFSSPLSVWAAGFGIDSNQITITTSDASYTPSVTTAGVVDSVFGMTGDLQSMSFSLVKDTVSDGTYSADLGVIVDDINNDRHIEASLLALDITVAGNDVTITIGAGNNVQLVGRNNDGTIIFYTTLDNLGEDSPLVVSGSSATVNFANLITKVEQKFGAESGEASVLNDITTTGAYTYQVFVKSASVPIGTVSGTTVTPFTSLADIGNSYSADGYADSDLETDLLGDLPDLTCTTAPYDDCLSPISNPSYLFGSCYILSGVYSVGDVGLLGDANGDQSVNIADALLVAQLAAGLISSLPDPTANVDVNSNGSSNIADALLIAQYAAGLITAWP